MSILNISHSPDLRNITPELQQALNSVVPKRQHNMALQALALADGDREAAEEENERLREANKTLVADNERLSKEVSRLNKALQILSLVREGELPPKERAAHN